MSDQLRRLIYLASYSNIDLRVLPNGLQRWTLAHEGAFVLYQFPKAAPIVHLEHYRGPAFLYEQDDVSVYVNALTELSDLASSHDRSVKLMSALAEEMEGTADDYAS